MNKGQLYYNEKQIVQMNFSIFVLQKIFWTLKMSQREWSLLLFNLSLFFVDV